MRTRGVRTGLAASGGFVAGGCSCPGRSVGQSHLNSDAKIADEGRVYGGEGTHKGCPYGMLAASGGFVPSGCSCPGRSVGQSHLNSDAKIVYEGRVYGGGGEGTHKGCPYRILAASGRWWMRLPWAFCRAIASEFRRQNSLRRARIRGGRAPTRGAPTGCWQPQEVLSLVDAGCPGRSVGQSHLNSDAKIADEGRAHGGGGHPQGVPLRVDFLGRARQGGRVRTRGVRTGGFLGGAHAGGGRVRTRGVRTGGLIGARTPRGEGAHKGCPYGWMMEARTPGGRVRTRGVRTGGFFGARAPRGEGAKGGGRAHQGGRVRTRGVRTGGFFGARTPRGEGAHKGCPYGWVFWARARQGGRARTPRGEGAHKGCPYGWMMEARTPGGGGCAQGVSVRVDF